MVVNTRAKQLYKRDDERTIALSFLIHTPKAETAVHDITKSIRASKTHSGSA